MQVSPIEGTLDLHDLLIQQCLMQGYLQEPGRKGLSVAEQPDYLTGTKFYKSGSSKCPRSTLPHAGYFKTLAEKVAERPDYLTGADYYKPGST